MLFVKTDENNKKIGKMSIFAAKTSSFEKDLYGKDAQLPLKIYDFEAETEMTRAGMTLLSFFKARRNIRRALLDQVRSSSVIVWKV